ncbi:unnamed protein product [Mycena citricolor]|uniref:Uncharacterized protein n=1 Tax=Mycena citricolor TaxID=2018698 RepID=A0AAD2K7A1_9AGAR|nr:unnamed protein product [Mycena citricolor]
MILSSSLYTPECDAVRVGPVPSWPSSAPWLDELPSESGALPQDPISDFNSSQKMLMLQLASNAECEDSVAKVRCREYVQNQRALGVSSYLPLPDWDVYAPIDCDSASTGEEEQGSEFWDPRSEFERKFTTAKREPRTRFQAMRERRKTSAVISGRIEKASRLLAPRPRTQATTAHLPAANMICDTVGHHLRIQYEESRAASKFS